MPLIRLLAGCLGWLSLLAALAWAIGWLTWGRRAPQLAWHPLPAALGLALLGHLALTLAATALFRPAPWLAVAGGLLAVAGGSAWRVLRAAPPAVDADAARCRPSRRAAALLAVATLLAGGLVAIYPPIAFDETIYHLPIARAITEHNALPFVPELRFRTFPALTEATQGLVLLHGDPVAGHGVQLLATVLTVLLVLRWGYELQGAAHGWIAAGLFLGNPLVVYLSGTGYVEAVLCLFATGALYAAWRWTRDPIPSWAAAAGALAGSAAAVKYLGLYFVAVLACTGLRRGWGGPAIFTLAALATAGPTYWWIHFATGDALHPFGARFLDTVGEPSGPLAPERTFWLALRLPWLAVVDRAQVGELPPLSPLFALGLLPLLPALPRRPRLFVPVAVAIGYQAVYLVAPADPRYLMAVLPLWALMLGGALVACWRQLDHQPPRAAIAALAAALAAAPGLAYGPFYAARLGPPPTTPEARERWLAAQVDGYAALRWLEQQRSDASVYALFGERLHGLFRGRLLGDMMGDFAYRRIVPALGEPARLQGRLRAMGADHLLLPRHAAPGWALADDPPLPLLYADRDSLLFAVP